MDARQRDLIESLKRQLKTATDPEKKKGLIKRIAAMKKEFTPASDSTGTGIPSRMPTRKNIEGAGIPSRMPTRKNIEGTGIPSRITVPKPKTAKGPAMMFDANLQQTTPDVGAATKKKSPSLGDIFKAKNWKKTSKGDDDYSPAKRTYDTPFGAIDLDTSKEGMFDDSELYDMGQKKGGRLKKAAGKKAVKKNAIRKRAALRGHRAELRGG
jgi:hypothetical protein